MACSRSDAEIVRDLRAFHGWLEVRHRSLDQLYLNAPRITRGDPDLHVCIGHVQGALSPRVLDADVERGLAALGYLVHRPEHGTVSIVDIAGYVQADMTHHERLRSFERVEAALSPG
jgi:hypothetical protein